MSRSICTSRRPRCSARRSTGSACHSSCSACCSSCSAPRSRCDKCHWKRSACCPIYRERRSARDARVSLDTVRVWLDLQLCRAARRSNCCACNIFSVCRRCLRSIQLYCVLEDTKTSCALTHRQKGRAEQDRLKERAREGGGAHVFKNTSRQERTRTQTRLVHTSS